MEALTIVGLSNLISTLVMIILQNGQSQYVFLLVQSLFLTLVMILNLDISQVFSSYLNGWGTLDPDNWLKYRVNCYLKHIEHAKKSNFLPILNIGIVFQGALLLMQSNQKITVSTLLAMSLHYWI